VFGTLHTNSASKAADRIIDVFPDESRDQVRGVVSVMLRGVLAQMLCKRTSGEGRVAVLEVMLQTIGIRISSARPSATRSMPICRPLIRAAACNPWTAASSNTSRKASLLWRKAARGQLSRRGSADGGRTARRDLMELSRRQWLVEAQALEKRKERGPQPWPTCAPDRATMP